MKRGSLRLVDSALQSSELWPSTIGVTTIRDGDEPSLICSILAIADGWLDERWEQFDPFAWLSSAERYARRKSFAEAAIYLQVAAAHGERDVAPRLRDLLLDRTSHRDYAELVRRYPRHFLLFSSPILYAASQGALTRDLASAVEEVLSGATVWATERPPHRMMDLWNFCTAWERAWPLGAVEDLLRLSAVGLPLDPIEANLRDAYALTHNLMFLYNFGVPGPGFPGEPVELSDIGDNLEKSLVLLTLRFLAELNGDVVLELLMAGAFQRRLPIGLTRLVLGWMDVQVKCHGGIPGPKQDDEHRLAVDDPNFQTWYADYHTTLVAASTLRTLRRDWDVIGERANEDLAGTWDPIVAQRVGEALNRLHRYELPLGIAQLHELLDQRPDQLVDAALEAAVAFLQRQQTASGGIGLFPDEKHAHDKVVAPGESFETSMGQAVSDIGADFLEAVRRK